MGRDRSGRKNGTIVQRSHWVKRGSKVGPKRRGEFCLERKRVPATGGRVGGAGKNGKIRVGGEENEVERSLSWERLWGGGRGRRLLEEREKLLDDLKPDGKMTVSYLGLHLKNSRDGEGEAIGEKGGD